ncbi:MAG: biotin/lipoyl-containing protein, partial [Brevundimonas sp.]|nr:biotin/lipoyl-containing protein [Brevundimonas sp.]
MFKLPDVGEGTAEAELVAWHVAVGDTVAEDQLLAEVMTDKATVELTSPVAGTVVALHGEAGQQIAVGGPLVSFNVEGRGNVTSPFPLEGGRVGVGGVATSLQDGAREAPPKASPSASSTKQPATTPTQPSPLEGEGLRKLSARG